MQIYYDRQTFSGQTSATSFVIEPGNIQIHITNWYEEGNVSGTPINKDYNTCVIERRNLVNRIFYQLPISLLHRQMLSIYVCTHQEEKTYLSVLYILGELNMRREETESL